MTALDLVPEDAGQVGLSLLDEVEAFMGRLVAFPSQSARVATVLWIAHAHAVSAFDSTPRLAALSPEPSSGKTRMLEAIATLVPNPMQAVNATPAALFRRVADQERPVTLLFDEIDAVFGPKAKSNEELRALLNAGHRRSGVAFRCVGEGTQQTVMEFPAFAPLALAGLGNLPDTIMSRSIVVRMRRRAPGEQVEPYRARIHEREGNALRDRLAAWTAMARDVWSELEPAMPDGVTDRPADVWEPLLVVADSAGGHWPHRARAACTALTMIDPATISPGVQVLSDLRVIFGDRNVMRTEDILVALNRLVESPWAEWGGKALNARGLSKLLGGYEIGPTDVKVGGRTYKGYRRQDLWDAWQRYLPPLPEERDLRDQGDQSLTSEDGVAGSVPHGRPFSTSRNSSATAGVPQASAVAPVAEVADLAQGGDRQPQVIVHASPAEPCEVCENPAEVRVNGRRVHPTCAARRAS